MSADTIDDKDVGKFATGFERYAFAKEFVLGSESWQKAEEKVKIYLANRKALSDVPSLYFEAGVTFWREYQFLFLCQFVEFKLTELIERVRVAGKLKPEFVEKLKKHRKADPRRVKDARRIISPASLLEDIGFTFGGLINIIENQTLPFNEKDSLLKELNIFNKNRVKFIHLSFGGRDGAGTDIAAALQFGKLLLARLEAFKVWS